MDVSAQASSEPRQLASRTPRSTRAWVPHFVFWLSLAATAGAAYYVHHAGVEQDHERFTQAAERTRIALSNRIENYSFALRNLVALFQTGGIPSRKQVHDYLARLDIARRFPGIQGVGFSLRVPEADRAGTEKTARENDLDPKFKI